MSAHRARACASPLGLAFVAFVACAPGDGAPPQIALAQPMAPGTCTEWTSQPVERSCLPRMAMSGAPLVLEIEERCGGCGTTAERCTVSVEGRVVNLSLDGKTCELPVGEACQETCVKRRVQCQVPPLEEGRYLVRYGDPAGRVDSLDVVPSREASTGCTLDDSGAATSPDGR
jgi:hypothetical protein